MLAEKTLKEGAQAALDAFLPKLLGTTTQKERPAVVERVRAMVLTATPRGIANALHGLAARADSFPTLREVRVPTLVVCGEEDTITPVADSEALVKGIAASRLEVVPRAGHLSNLENPQAENAALQSFLATLP